MSDSDRILIVSSSESDDEYSNKQRKKPKRSEKSKPKKTVNSKKGVRASLRNKKSTNVINNPVNEEPNLVDDISELSSSSNNKRTRGGRYRGRGRNNSRKAPPSVVDPVPIVFDDTSDFPMTENPINFNSKYSRKTTVADDDRFLDLDDLDVSLGLGDDRPNCVGDHEVTLSIDWFNSSGVTQKIIKIGRYERFRKVIEELAKSENVPLDRTVLMRDHEPIHPDHTPFTLGIDFCAILSALVVPEPCDFDTSHKDFDKLTSKLGKDAITLKLQFEGNKEVVLFSFTKHDKMSVVFKRCADELKCDECKVKVNFDGEYVNPNDLANVLDIENGDLLNVYVKH